MISWKFCNSFGSCRVVKSSSSATSASSVSGDNQLTIVKFVQAGKRGEANEGGRPKIRICDRLLGEKGARHKSLLRVLCAPEEGHDAYLPWLGLGERICCRC